MSGFVNDFKKFITKGNVIELAIAVVIGGAFSKIVQSLVNDIVMPLLSLLIGRAGFQNLKFVISEANPALGITENAIYYGRFIQNAVDFLVIALIIFTVFRFLNKIIKEAEVIKNNTIKKIKK